MLEHYQIDVLRCFISAVGPESQDADFTWVEFVYRANGELVTAWSNLVSCTAMMMSKRFDEVPPAGKLEGIDQELLDMIAAGFDTVGGLVEVYHQGAALGETVHSVDEANRYVAQTEPSKLKDESQCNRLGTISHVLTQAVTDLNRMTSPFLPVPYNTIDRVLSGEGNITPMLRIEEVVDLDASSDNGSPCIYPTITGDHTDIPTWERHPVTVSQKVVKPVLVLEKLDESVVDEEITHYADLLGKWTACK